MKYFRRFFCIAQVFLIGNLLVAQPTSYNAGNAHSHNDYLNSQPFHNAYAKGFGSIEADVFPVNGTLCVAHHKKEIDPKQTLKTLYLDPLFNKLKNDNSQPVKLLIDIKEDYLLSLQLLIKELGPLRKYLSVPGKKRLITILVSGSRPPPGEYKNYPNYIFFDDDLKLPHTTFEWKRVGQVSLPFTRYSTWNGIGSIETKEKELIAKAIDSVHEAGKTIRFWAAPDNETSWLLQMKSGVDLIGTDKIDELSTFLRRRAKKK